MSVKKSIDTIGNRTRDLPACSAVMNNHMTSLFYEQHDYKDNKHNFSSCSIFNWGVNLILKFLFFCYWITW